MYSTYCKIIPTLISYISFKWKLTNKNIILPLQSLGRVWVEHFGIGILNLKVTRKLLQGFGYDGWYSWVRRWIDTSGLLTGKSGSQRELTPVTYHTRRKEKWEKSVKERELKSNPWWLINSDQTQYTYSIQCTYCKNLPALFKDHWFRWIKIHIVNASVVSIELLYFT